MINGNVLSCMKKFTACHCACAWKKYCHAALWFGGVQTRHQMVWPWKLQSSHLLSSSIFQKVDSHSPVSSFFSFIQRASCIIRRGMSQSLHNDSTVSSSSRGLDVLLNSGPQASLSLHTSSICSNENSGFHSWIFWRISPMVLSAVTATANMPSVVSTFTSGT